MGRWIVAAAILAAVVVGAVVFVGCGGVGVDVARPIRVEPIELARPIELAGPIRLEQLQIGGTVPIVIQSGVPIQLPGPVTIQVQGPSVEYEGTYVSEALMERILVGQTTGEWVLAVVGPPQTKTPMSDGTEIWKWVYRPTGTTAPLLPVLGEGDREKPHPQPITAFVRIKEGVVVDKWRG